MERFTSSNFFHIETRILINRAPKEQNMIVCCLQKKHLCLITHLIHSNILRNILIKKEKGILKMAWIKFDAPVPCHQKLQKLFMRQSDLTIIYNSPSSCWIKVSLDQRQKNKTNQATGCTKMINVADRLLRSKYIHLKL